ncbi:hypothetical protein U1Q18_010796 [Sarracenia purpurea var. burkii]
MGILPLLGNPDGSERQSIPQGEIMEDQNQFESLPQSLPKEEGPSALRDSRFFMQFLESEISGVVPHQHPATEEGDRPPILTRDQRLTPHQILIPDGGRKDTQAISSPKNKFELKFKDQEQQRSGMQKSSQSADMERKEEGKGDSGDAEASKEENADISAMEIDKNQLSTLSLNPEKALSHHSQPCIPKESVNKTSLRRKKIRARQIQSIPDTNSCNPPNAKRQLDVVDGVEPSGDSKKAKTQKVDTPYEANAASYESINNSPAAVAALQPCRSP